MRHEASQWRWIKQNRRLRDRAEALCAPAARALEGASVARPQQVTRLAATLADIMDLALENRWSVHAFERGILTICIHDRRYIGTARVRWALDILERLQVTCPDCHVHRVRFVALAGNRRSIRPKKQTRNT